MTNQRTMVTLGLICMLVSVGLGQFACDPYKDCSVSVAGDFVPDPYDCEQYYVCIDAGGSVVPSFIPISCDYGYYFDQIIRTCVPEVIPDVCVNLCQTLCRNGCEGVTDGSLAGFKGNCSLYFYCFEEPILLSCAPPDIYFTGMVCVADPAQCCDFCEPYCESGGLQIQDPCDCTSYYVCPERGEPSEDYRGTCETGYYYDEPTVSCVPGQCFNFCSDIRCAAFRKRENVIH